MAQTRLSSVQTLGLLRPGVTREQVLPELEVIFDGLRQETPAILKGWTTGAVDLRQAQFGSRRPAVLMLLAAVLALGLIAIANLANLTLADVMFRRGDFAVRAALGASRGELAATEIAQSVILACAGGAAGLAGAAWLVPALLALDPSSADARAARADRLARRPVRIQRRGDRHAGGGGRPRPAARRTGAGVRRHRRIAARDRRPRRAAHPRRPGHRADRARADPAVVRRADRERPAGVLAHESGIRSRRGSSRRSSGCRPTCFPSRSIARPSSSACSSACAAHRVSSTPGRR